MPKMPEFIKNQISKSVDDPVGQFCTNGGKVHKIEKYAIKQGWMHRSSVSQAHWQEKGIYDAGLWNPVFHGTYRGPK